MLPKAPLYFPMTMEREYLRIVDRYMMLFYTTLAKQLPVIRKATSGECKAKIIDLKIRLKIRHDANDIDTDVGYIIEEVFARIQEDFNQQALLFDLGRRITTLANQTRRLSITQWRRVVRQSLGINIMEDYYMGEFFRTTLIQWITNNIGLIESAPQSALTELRNIIQEGWQSGLSNRDISRQIQSAYEKYKNKTDFWARDQMAKLNADMSEQQQKDAGVEEYVWSTSGDERVRGNPSGKWPDGDHYQLDGTRHNWINPPVVDKRTGRCAHPGKDFNCRCVALPVFNLPGLSLPWEGGDQD